MSWNDWVHNEVALNVCFVFFFVCLFWLDSFLQSGCERLLLCCGSLQGHREHEAEHGIIQTLTSFSFNNSKTLLWSILCYELSRCHYKCWAADRNRRVKAHWRQQRQTSGSGVWGHTPVWTRDGGNCVRDDYYRWCTSLLGCCKDCATPVCERVVQPVTTGVTPCLAVSSSCAQLVCFRGKYKCHINVIEVLYSFNGNPGGIFLRSKTLKCIFLLPCFSSVIY